MLGGNFHCCLFDHEDRSCRGYIRSPLTNEGFSFFPRDIIGKLKSGIDKFNEESIMLYLTPPFRKMPRPPLARVSRGKVLNYVGRTSAAILVWNHTRTCTSWSSMRVDTPLICKHALHSVSKPCILHKYENLFKE